MQGIIYYPLSFFSGAISASGVLEEVSSVMNLQSDTTQAQCSSDFALSGNLQWWLSVH